MKENMRVGIIGLGLVGKALYNVMRIFHEDVRGYDIDPTRTKNSAKSLLECDVLFLTLPTYLNDEGHLDTHAIVTTLQELVKETVQGLIVIKSTLPYGSLGRMMTKCPHLNIIHCPEILHVTAPELELVTPQYMVVSQTTSKNLRTLQMAFHWVPAEKFKMISPEAAEIYKLVQNTFACTKISFVNEVERFCKSKGINVEEVMRILRQDKRCADEYSYPNRGPYGGDCLPKDIQELITSYPDNILFKAVKAVNDRATREGVKD